MSTTDHSATAMLCMLPIWTSIVLYGLLGPRAHGLAKGYVAASRGVSQARVEALVDVSDVIVRGSIQRVVEVQQSGSRMPHSVWPSGSIRLAAILVTTSIYGSQGQGSTMWVLLDPKDVLPEPAATASDVLLLLRPDRRVWVWASDATLKRLHRIAGTEDLWSADPGGLLVIQGAGVTCSQRSRHHEAVGDDGLLEVVDVIGAIKDRLRATLPSINVSGPQNWSVFVARDGMWMSGAERGHVRGDGAQALWLAMDELRLSGIPPVVGQSVRPGDLSMSLYYRGLTGTIRCRIYSRGLAPEEARWRRLLENLWSVLPDSRKPRMAWEYLDE